MRTTGGYERLAVFADAVTAIAITLLVLPLLDLEKEPGTTLAHFLYEHRQEILVYCISFAVIARLWYSLHQLGEYMDRYNTTVVVALFVWLFSIASLPFTTSLLGGDIADVPGQGRWVSVLYIATLLLNVLSLAVIQLDLLRNTDLRRSAVTQADLDRLGPWWTLPLSILLALILTAAVPSLGVWSLLLLLAEGPVAGALAKRNLVVS